MKKATALLLAILMCACVFSACSAQKPADAGNAADTPDAPQSESAEIPEDGENTDEPIPGDEGEPAEDARIPGNADELDGKAFTWGGMTFSFLELTTDLGDWGSQLVAPEGKWVEAVFEITDGQMECGMLEELIVDTDNIRLDDYLPRTISEQGIAIEENTVFAVGFINVFFDVAEDFDLEKANLYVAEAVEIAEEDEGADVPSPGEENARARMEEAGIGNPVSDDDNLMGISLQDVLFDEDGDVFIRWAFSNSMMQNNMTYAYTRMRFFDPADLSAPYAAFTINEDNTFSISFKTGDDITFLNYVHLNHEEFHPESGVIFMYFDGSGDAPASVYTVPLTFTIYVDDDGPHAVETTPRYAPQAMIDAYNG